MNTETQKQPVAKPEKKPNERVGVRFSSAFTIKDPETGKVLVQQRCS